MIHLFGICLLQLIIEVQIMFSGLFLHETHVEVVVYNIRPVSVLLVAAVADVSDLVLVGVLLFLLVYFELCC